MCCRYDSIVGRDLQRAVNPIADYRRASYSFPVQTVYWRLPPINLQNDNSMKSFVRAMEVFIFWSRWVQAPLYLGLIVAQGVYVYQFMLELSHLVLAAGSLKQSDIMLIVLGLIDVVMIANLLIMVIIGGYETFVSRLDLQDHPDLPEWLHHVNAGALKVKLAMALIGISSIDLLQTFINAEHVDDHTVISRVAIHLTFLVSAIALAWTDKLMVGTQNSGKA